MAVLKSPSSSKKKKATHKKSKNIRWIWFLLRTSLLFFFVLGVGGYVVLYQVLAKQNPGGDYEKSHIIDQLGSETLIFYEGGDSLLGSLFEKAHRRYVAYDEIPQTLIEAVVAGEDAHFFQHGGVEYLGIVRAALINMIKGRAVQGGSTITQQTAKNIFGRPEQSLAAKAVELVQALRLEHHFTKQEILEFYLNQFFVVGTGRGVGIAAEYFFNRPLKELNKKECAFIAASLKGPFNYDPFSQKDSTRISKALKKGENRIEYILSKMVEQNYLTPKEKEQVKKLPLRFDKGQFLSEQGILIQAVVRELSGGEIQDMLVDKYGEEWQKAGLRIETTLNANWQKQFEDSLNVYLDSLAGDLGDRPQGALVVLDSNRVRAYVGGYHNKGYDRVMKSRRQLGSTWKTPLIALALEEGYSSNDLLENHRSVFRMNKQFYFPSPDHKDRGEEVTLQWALTRSENIASVHLLMNLLEKAGPSRREQLAVKYKMSRKAYGSRKEWLAQLRDQWDIPIDGMALNEVRLEVAKSALMVDWLLADNQYEVRWLKSLEMGRGYEEQLKKESRRLGSKKHLDLLLNYLSLEKVFHQWDRDEESLHYYKLAENRVGAYDFKRPGLVELDVDDVDEDDVYLYGYFKPDHLEDLIDAYEEQVKKIEALDENHIDFLIDYRRHLSLEHFRHFMNAKGMVDIPPGVMSLPLGSVDISLLEMSSLYEHLFQKQVREYSENEQPWLGLITRISDGRGQVLYEAPKKAENPWQFAPDFKKWELALSLKSVVDHGTGRKARSIGIHREGLSLRWGVGGKTGTTNDFKNTAFVGIIPRQEGSVINPMKPLVLGVYIGFDDNRPMRSKSRSFSGATAALPLWNAVAGFVVDAIAKPERINFKSLDHLLNEEITWRGPKDWQMIRVDRLTGIPSDSSGLFVWQSK